MRAYPVSEPMVQRLINDFQYHPAVEDQQQRYERIRSDAQQLALLIVGHTPPGREQAVALTKLEEAVMWANAAIARNE